MSLLERVAAPSQSALPLPRLLVVLAHPDDEVLALGARLERLRTSRFLTVTDGAPQDGADALHHGFSTLAEYGAARRKELETALSLAGLPPSIAAPLAGAAPIPVPDQTAALHLPELVQGIAEAIRILAPDAVLTHPYEGGHPDHDACAFAVHTAVRLIQEESRSVPNGQATAPSPVILEAPSYHAGEQGSMVTGRFLETSVTTPTVTRVLSLKEQASKRVRLACFTSQAEVLSQFGVERESFRIAPVYNFTQPPHPGQLFYEQFPWGMSGERFRSLTADSLKKLFGPRTTSIGLTPPEGLADLAAVPHS